MSIILIFSLSAFIYAQSEFAVCGYAYQKYLDVKKTQDDLPNVEPFMQFWSKLRLNIYQKKIDLNKNYKIQIKGSFPQGKISEGDISFTLNHNQPKLLELLKDFLVAVDDSKLMKVMALERFGETINGADLQIDFAENDVNFKLALKTNSENTAERVTTRFKILFSATALVLRENPAGDFYKNAEITSQKEKIFVCGKITRANLEKYLSY